MKALLRKYDGETIAAEEIIDLPDNYDGNPYGDTVPFVVASNWTITPAESELDLIKEQLADALECLRQFRNAHQAQWGDLDAWLDWLNGASEAAEVLLKKHNA